MNYKHIIKAVFVSGLWLSQVSVALANDKDSSTQSPIDSKITPSAGDDSLWQRLMNNISQAWDSPNQELYIPLNTWHNRWTYDDDKIESYNERPWGIGYGKYRYDEDNNWHSVYAMAFMDSHNEVEPIIGYGYQKMWIPGEMDGWRFGIGFTASITARHEYHYIPIPLPLPLISIEYNKFALQTTYIPGTYNNGNVLFTWMRWQF
ncbi:lipid IV(A) palmitoyltransferase PagP [Yersinia alsatica]|uniref:lipid IV(A) palmitoyltransferase PagP n=1 Tax=Yersinia alsatica TaxID=2890317 RepID=UPI0005E6F1F9|nr:lipid IV(A) palmitoyltransferase PagP [Yersinia alsatica]OVZ91184.1 phospholipid:lipid A palmitoyltransferase [Yersinia frederiksenii]CNK18756.1 palmitoyl transferase [Yersinia frederiksenii]